MATCGVELRQAGLYRGYVAEDTAIGHMGEHGLEGIYSIFHRSSINHHVGSELVDLVKTTETPTVECKKQPSGVGVDNCHLMFAGKDVAEERPHLSGTYYQYLHFIKFMRPI